MSAIREIRHRAFAPVLLQLFLVGLPIGIAAMLLVPGVLSLGPSAAISLPELVIPLREIKPGELLDLREHPDSRGVPLAVYGRIEVPGLPEETSSGAHADHAFSKEVLPDGVDPATRSANPAIFVFLQS